MIGRRAVGLFALIEDTVFVLMQLSEVCQPRSGLPSMVVVILFSGGKSKTGPICSIPAIFFPNT